MIRLSDDQKHRAERVLAQADRNRDEIRFRLKVIEQQKPCPLERIMIEIFKQKEFRQGLKVWFYLFLFLVAAFLIENYLLG